MAGREGYKKISTDDMTERKEEKVGFLSLLLFQWMNNVFKTGSKRALNQDDFLSLAKENSTGFLTVQLQANWNKEKTKCTETGKKPKLWKSVLKTLSVKDTLIIICSGFLYSLSRVLQPLFLGYVISTLMSAGPKNNYLFYGCALAMCLCALIGSIAMHHQNFTAQMLGMRISSSLKGLVYNKVSTSVNNVNAEASTGLSFNMDNIVPWSWAGQGLAVSLWA